MVEYTDCVICNKKVKLDKSIEIVDVRSNIRDFQGNTFTVWRCPYCNSIHSKQDIDLTKYYKNYPIFDLKNKLFINFNLSRRLKRLKRAGLKKDDRILDYGCGSGNMVYYLNLVGYKNVFGYDKYNKRYSDENLLENRYDYIICQDVLEHTKKPILVLKKLAKLLKTTGFLSIGTTNADYINLNNPEKIIMPLHQPYHRHIISEKSLILHAKKIGLKVKKIYHRYYINSLLPFNNHRFMFEYRIKKGNMLEPVFGKILDFKIVLTPKMIFYAIFGYFFFPKNEMEIIFYK